MDRSFLKPIPILILTKLYKELKVSLHTHNQHPNRYAKITQNEKEIKRKEKKKVKDLQHLRKEWLIKEKDISFYFRAKKWKFVRNEQINKKKFLIKFLEKMNKKKTIKFAETPRGL